MGCIYCTQGCAPSSGDGVYLNLSCLFVEGGGKPPRVSSSQFYRFLPLQQTKLSSCCFLTGANVCGLGLPRRLLIRMDHPHWSADSAKLSSHPTGHLGGSSESHTHRGVVSLPDSAPEGSWAILRPKQQLPQKQIWCWSRTEIGVTLKDSPVEKERGVFGSDVMKMKKRRICLNQQTKTEMWNGGLLQTPQTVPSRTV